MNISRSPLQPADSWFGLVPASGGYRRTPDGVARLCLERLLDGCSRWLVHRQPDAPVVRIGYG